MLFALADGILLFSKIPEVDQLIAQAKEILKEGPPVNEKWGREAYRTKKRSDLTEIYLDMLDAEDEVTFQYLVSLLVTSAIPMMNEIDHMWYQTRKKTMGYLKSQCKEAYRQIEILLSVRTSMDEKRSAAKGLIDYVFRQDGGVLEGEALIFCIE